MEKNNFQDILKNIDIDLHRKEFDKDNIKELLFTNKPIEDKLHVIAVVSNPCNYKIRYKLTKEFIARMEKEINVIPESLDLFVLLRS